MSGVNIDRSDLTWNVEEILRKTALDLIDAVERLVKIADVDWSEVLADADDDDLQVALEENTGEPWVRDDDDHRRIVLEEADTEDLVRALLERPITERDEWLVVRADDTAALGRFLGLALEKGVERSVDRVLNARDAIQEAVSAPLRASEPSDG